MSDSDDKLLGNLSDLDWDSALDEWEKNTFVPEVARDTETNRVAAPVSEEEQQEQKAPRPAAGKASAADASSSMRTAAPSPRRASASHSLGRGLKSVRKATRDLPPHGKWSLDWGIERLG